GVVAGGEPVDHRVVALQRDQRDEPLVVRRRGQQVPDAQVTRAEPVVPRHPRRREQRPGPRQQHRLADRDQLGPRRAGDRHRPSPPGVRRILAGEQVGHDAFAVGEHLEVLAHLVGPHDLGDGAPGEVNGLGTGLIRFLGAGADRTHGHRFSLITVAAALITCCRGDVALAAVARTNNTGYMRMSEALRRTGSAARATTGAVRSGTRRTGGLVHRVTSAQGAGRTGLSTLIELTAAAGAGDAFVIVSLAGTIFFNTSVEQARGKVVLFLVVTMAPFAVLAPFIGPALDRVQQGRKYLLAGTLLARGLLCYAMAAAVSNPINLLPAAFGVLVLQKAYGVVRASVAPRLLPEQITLVRANARSQLIAVITATLAAGLAE